MCKCVFTFLHHSWSVYYRYNIPRPDSNSLRWLLVHQRCFLISYSVETHTGSYLSTSISFSKSSEISFALCSISLFSLFHNIYIILIIYIDGITILVIFCFCPSTSSSSYSRSFSMAFTNLSNLLLSILVFIIFTKCRVI